MTRELTRTAIAEFRPGLLKMFEFRPGGGETMPGFRLVGGATRS